MHFDQRLYIFQQLLDHDKAHFYHGSLGGLMGLSSVRVTIRRDNLLQDSFATLNRIGSKLKGTSLVVVNTDIDLYFANRTYSDRVHLFSGVCGGWY